MLTYDWSKANGITSLLLSKVTSCLSDWVLLDAKVQFQELIGVVGGTNMGIVER